MLSDDEDAYDLVRFLAFGTGFADKLRLRAHRCHFPARTAVPDCLPMPRDVGTTL